MTVSFELTVADDTPIENLNALSASVCTHIATALARTCVKADDRRVVFSRTQKAGE